MFFRATSLTAAVVLFLYPQIAGSAGPVSVQYALVPMGGNVYRYVYTITNNGSLPSGAAIKLFDILFDPTLYQESSLQIVTSQVNNSLTSQWQQQILTSLPSLPADYDALAIGGNTGITVGSTVSGFAVQFTWLGTGLPGAQPFQVYDPSSTPFQLLQTGQTTATAPTPAASTFSLLLIGTGLASAGLYYLRHQGAVIADAKSSVSSES